MGELSRLDLGAYDARRAAALSGVPRSTVYDWASKGVITPSIRSHRAKLWSYGDLLTLRLVRWLRQPKESALRTSMAEVRLSLDRFGDVLWEDGDAGGTRSTIVVAPDGTVAHCELSETAAGQGVLPGSLDLLARFEHGVDLRRPSERLRLVPGRCGGEIHLVGTRLTTLALTALQSRGYDQDHISRLYPHDDPAAIAEAIEVEQHLAQAA